MRLYLVTDQRPDDDALVATVAAAVAGGVTLVQLRDKTATTAERVAMGRRLRAVTGPVPVVVNDDVEAAAALDGVHVGPDDVSPVAARAALGPGAIVGWSIHDLAQLDDAATLAACDYVAISPVWATATKPDHTAPLGLDGVRAAVARAGDTPVLGIGGIDVGNARSVVAAGAAGVCVVSAICSAAEPRAAAAALRDVVEPGGARVTAREPVVLTVAGSDPSGGAGVQADLKTFTALGVYGAAVLTALTAQNTTGVQGVHAVPAAFVTAQLSSVLGDLDVRAVKTGMLGDPALVAAVADGLAVAPAAPLVFDPVLVATSGDRLVPEAAVAAIRERLLPRATVVTPNVPEARLLAGVDDLAEAGRRLVALGARFALVKGGHLDGPEVVDLLVDADGVTELRSPRVDTPHTHGTGCTLSAAVAARLAVGDDVPTAVDAARAYLVGALRAGRDRLVGAGSGPVDHLWRLR